VFENDVSNSKGWDVVIMRGDFKVRYMFLIYTKEDALAAMNPQEAARVYNGHRAVMEDAKQRGIFRGAEPLEPASVATTVRVRDGNVIMTDGPFTETKEQLAGYYILDCEHLDEASAWAARIPTGCGGNEGCVEIRPLRQISAPPEFSNTDVQPTRNSE
jgi:hypothetical protein